MENLFKDIFVTKPIQNVQTNSVKRVMFQSWVIRNCPVRAWWILLAKNSFGNVLVCYEYRIHGRKPEFCLCSNKPRNANGFTYAWRADHLFYPKSYSHSSCFILKLLEKTLISCSTSRVFVFPGIVYNLRVLIK